MSAYKSQMIKSDASSAVSEAFSELQSLRDEMAEWADNLESGNLGHTNKFSEVEAARDALDSIADNEIEVPDFLEGEIEVTIQVNRRKNKGPSRAVRRDNAIAHLDAAKAHAESMNEALEEEKAGLEDEDDPSEEETHRLAEIEDQVQALEEFIGDVENAISEAEGAEFPRMYS